MMRAIVRWLLNPPPRPEPPAPPAPPIDRDPDPYGEDYGCNSIFGMG